MQTPKPNDHEVTAESDTVIMANAAHWERAEEHPDEEQPTVVALRLDETGPG